MRPYLAIFKDSFREAVSSRTLPVLLVFFTVFLAAMAPIGLKEEVSWKLRPADIADLRLLAIKLRGEAAREGENPSKRVLERLPDGLRLKLTDPAGLEGDKPSDQNPFGPTKVQEDLAEAVNDEVLTDETFYSAGAWKGRPLSDEAKALIGKGVDRLSDDEVHRLNRLLFDAAYTGAVSTVSKSSAEIKWFGADLPFISDATRGVTVDKAEVQRQAQATIGFLSGWLVGPIGLLAAVFVTSTIIPRMFEAGAIDLLLSKPVSRSGLFLARFFSGCAFVFVTFSYLIVGIWLIVGLRLDVWNNGLLLTIPLLLFGFSVIYSISAVTGVMWRNPIVSVFIAVVVWGAAFLVGLSQDVTKLFRNSGKVREITFADGTPVIADKDGRVFLWSSSGEDWQEILKGPDRPPMMGLAYPLLGPVYDPKANRLISADVGPGGSNRLFLGIPERKWERIDGAALPPAARSLAVTNDGRLIVAGQSGLFRLEGEPFAKAAEWNLWGLTFAPKDVKNGFVRIDTDREGGWSRDSFAAVDRATGAIVVADKGHLIRFEPDGSEYRQTGDIDLKTDKSAVLGVGGGRVIAAFADGAVRVLDSATLKEIGAFTLPKGELPHSVEVSPNGAYAALLTHGGDVTLFDARKGTAIEAEPRGQGDISAVAFGADGSLWVADRLKRVTRLDTKLFDAAQTLEGPLSTGEIIYRYVLAPLGWILPNTYGLGNAQTYLFTDQKSEAVGGPEARLDSERVTSDIWGPIWQNAAFLFVVLGATCVYISRKDF